MLSVSLTQKVYHFRGKIPYGEITSHCGTNTSHIICIGGEPRHAHNDNTDSCVQIAAVTYL